MESKKNDRKDDKLMWELIPLTLIEWVVKVYHFGCKKYGPNTWQGLDDGYNRYKAAMFRHIVAHEKGEWLDSESGLPHLAHMAWNALAMLYYSLNEKKEEQPQNIPHPDSCDKCAFWNPFDYTGHWCTSKEKCKDYDHYTKKP